MNATGLPANAQLSAAIGLLEKQAARLTNELGKAVQMPGALFHAGGGIWSPEAVSGPVTLAKQGPVLESPAVSTDLYAGFYDPRLGNRIRPLGIADLNVVEQTLCCYEAGEVAHIENISRANTRSAAPAACAAAKPPTRLKPSRRKPRSATPKTTDRYELQKEASQVLQEAQASSLGITANASWGPVSVAVSANFNTSSSSQTTDQQTSDYAKSIVDRSVQRVVERTRTTRQTRLTEEYEETAKHGLDNRNGTAHVVGPLPLGEQALPGAGSELRQAPHVRVHGTGAGHHPPVGHVEKCRPGRHGHCRAPRRPTRYEHRHYWQYCHPIFAHAARCQLPERKQLFSMGISMQCRGRCPARF